MLRNLVLNAILYTEKGGALIGCRRISGGLRIAVYDTGPGIPEADQDRIFGAFERIGAEGSGHGLGLAIVKTMAESLGCTLRLCSRPGLGSCFAIDVPLPAAGDPAPDGDAAPEGRAAA
jgi:signal transduction histidine kinase